MVSLLPEPALLISMSQPPSSRSTVAIRWAQPSAVATSAPIASALVPWAASISRARSVARSPSRAAIATTPPSAARPCATARPIPTLPPVITATLSVRPRSIAALRLFDDRDLAAVDGDGDGQDQHQAEDDLLGEDVDAHEGHADPHHRDDQGADQGAPDAADAAGDRGTADHHGRDRRQQQLVGERGRAGGEATGEHHAGQTGERPRQCQRQHLLPADLDPRGVGGRLAGANGRTVAAEAGAALQQVGAQEDNGADEDLVRYAEADVADPGEPAPLGLVEGN